MSGKKIFSIDVPVDEDMYQAMHGFAKADGISASELVRMLCDSYIEDRRAYYARLVSIFGDKTEPINKQLPGHDPVIPQPTPEKRK